MNASNTKLTKAQKQALKKFKKNNPNVEFFSFPVSYSTVAIQEEFPGSKMWKVSVSYASQNERKFRVKVGEYHAMERMKYSEFVKVPRDNYSSMHSLAWEFALL